MYLTESINFTWEFTLGLSVMFSNKLTLGSTALKVNTGRTMLFKSLKLNVTFFVLL